MSVETLGLFFPLILGIHNTEEYLRYHDFVRPHHRCIPGRFLSRPVIRNAAVFLTLVAAVVCVLAWLRGTELLSRVVVASTVALALNALGHVGMTMMQRTVMPGTVSAVALVLPYSVCVIVMFRASMGASWASLLGMAGLGLLLIPASVAVFLSLGYAAMLLEQRFRGTPDV